MCCHSEGRSDNPLPPGSPLQDTTNTTLNCMEMAKLSLGRPWSFPSIRPFWTSKTDKHPAGKSVTIHMFVMTVSTNSSITRKPSYLPKENTVVSINRQKNTCVIYFNKSCMDWGRGQSQPNHCTHLIKLKITGNIIVHVAISREIHPYIKHV